jgi:DNA polymerase elongation subunit (family B)
MADLLVFDIETVPDPELVPEPRPDAIPKIPFNRVVLIGAATLSVQPGASPSESNRETYRFEGLRVLSGPEPEILAEFWRLAEGTRLVSFNGRHFDLPVLEARSLRHGLALPWYFATGSLRHDPALHLDLLEFLSNGEPRNRARLDDYCKLVGLPGKMGIDGAQVAALFADQRVEELSAYCATDVLQTLGLFLRVQRLRGACLPAAFPQMLRGMRDAIARRVDEHAGLERERLQAFMLQSEPFWAAI